MLFPVIPLLPYFFSALFFIHSFLSFLLHLNLSSFLHHSLSLFLSLLTLFSLPFSFSFHSFVYFPLFSTAFHCLSLFSIPLFFFLLVLFQINSILFFSAPQSSFSRFPFFLRPLFRFPPFMQFPRPHSFTFPILSTFLHFILDCLYYFPLLFLFFPYCFSFLLL